jgi:hypothetical protein
MTVATTEPREATAFDDRDEKVLDYLGLNPNRPADRAMVAVCRAYDLDPVLKHVVVIPKGGVYITRDGLLHVAHRSGQLDGIVVEQEPTLDQATGEWVARVSVYRKDMRHPFTFPGRYSASGGNRAYAPEMALKAAEAHALRRAFDVTGIPTLDEQRPEREPRGGLAAALAEQDAPEEPVDGELVEQAVESPLLDTSSSLARRMFALYREAGIDEKADRLAHATQVVGRVITSSAELTEEETRHICDDLADRQEAAS